MTLELLGAICFGIVIGFVTYRTLRKTQETVALSNIATVIAAVGGAAVTALFEDRQMFGAYCVGLFLGFFLYLALGNTVFKDTTWLGSGE